MSFGSASFGELAFGELEAASGDIEILATTDVLTLTEYSASIGVTVSGSTDVLTLTEYQATITLGAVANPGARFEQVDGVLPTSTPVDLTITGFGTPETVILFVSGATGDATIEANARLGVGVVDDTLEGSISIVCEDAVGFSNANRTIDSNVASGASAPGDQLLAIQISGALIENGVRLTVVDAPAAAYRVTALLIGGDGIELAEVIIKDDLGNTIGDQQVDLAKTWASAPNLLIGMTMGGSAIPPEAEQQAIMTMGWSDFTNHRGMMLGATDASATSYLGAMVSKVSMLGQVLNGVTQWTGYPHTPTTTEFQFNVDTATGTDIAIFLVLKLASGFVSSIHDVTIPSDADAEIETSINPSFSLVALAQGPTVYDTRVDDIDGAGAFVLYDGTTTSAISASIADNVAKSVHSDSLAVVDSAGAAPSIVGTIAFEGTKSVWTTSTRPGAPILGIGLAIGTSAGGSQDSIISDCIQDAITDAIEDAIV